jgi:hypothetical protein
MPVNAQACAFSGRLQRAESELKSILCCSNLTVCSSSRVKNSVGILTLYIRKSLNYAMPPSSAHAHLSRNYKEVTRPLHIKTRFV